MPVISPTRYSTGSSSSYLPPSIGGTTSSSLGKSSGYGTTSSYHPSNYRSSSLSNSYSSGSYSSGSYSSASTYLSRPTYRSSLSGTSSIYRTGSYLTGGNNDTTATSRFGVSSNRLSRASSDRDTLKRVTGKTQYNNNTINTTSRSKALQTKPPLGASSSSIRHQRTSSDIIRSRDNSLTRVTSKSDPNSNCINNNDTSDPTDQPKNKISPSLSSSSLARQVATSGLDLYEKYSPAHYIPNCELSRSRSLSEATSSSNKNKSSDSGLSNSSSNVHQLLQTAKEIKQQKQQYQNENDLQNLNLKSSSPPSSSHQTSSSTSAKDISKVKKLCAVSTTATTNNFSKFATGSVVVISNNKDDLNANAFSTYINKNSLESGIRPEKSSHHLVNDLPLDIVSSNNFDDHTHNVDITHTTNPISSIKPSIQSSVVNIVTNNPSEHDNNNSSKHSNNNNVIKSATTIQFEQQKSNSSLASKSATNSVNNNSASSQIASKKFQKSPPAIATSASTTTALSSKPIATTTFQTITSSILSSSAIPPASPAATAVATTNSSSSQKIVSNDTSDKYSATNNANAILKAVKSNLKPTSKVFLCEKLVNDKTMTSLYSEANGNSNNNNNSSINTSYKTGSTILTINNSTSSSSARSETVAEKARNLLKSTSNALDVHLEFYKNKLQPLDITRIKNTSPVQGASSTSKSGNNSKFIGLSYREPNFLKNECELARSQVAKSNEASSNDNNNIHSNGNKNVLANNGFEKGSSKYEKNLIKPLVHKSTTNKSHLSRTPSNNNMNCLQNGGGPDLDDIKFIDSDDSERQQHNGHNYHQLHQSHKRTASNSASNTESASGPYTSPSRTLSERKDIGYISSNKLSTLPLTTKHHRDLLYSSDSTKSVTSKYNTLNDFKRIPSNASSGVRSSLHRNVDLISSSSSSSSSPPSSTTTPIKTFTTSTSALAKSSVVMIHHQNGAASHESTPSTSPQTLRRRNATTTITHSVPHNSSDSTSIPSALSSKTIAHLQHPQSSGISTTSSSHSQSSTSATSTSLEEKISNKICDNDESVRNASIRSALPPSPTPSRYWEREGRSSALAAGRSYTDTDENSTSKSSLSTSSNSYDKTTADGLCGLRNIGNTCYMNSVIQCLSHTRELTKFLKSQVSTKSSTKDQQILLEFAKLIREMWSPNVRSVTPLELKSAFSSKHRMYSGYNQQDAQEFLRFFLDSLHSALNSGVKGEQLKIDDSLSDNKKADLTWDWYAKIENSVVRDLFVGQLKSTLKCTTCGNTSVTFDPFWDLSVPLQSSSRCKLDSCLDLFIREEVLDGDEMPTCSKCQTRRKCTKTFTIQRFPKYLVIHLKRFSETRWSKMSNVVEFPTGERELNMAPYAANSNVSATYSLYGIANHMGSTAGGHYVALCKHPVTKKWHEFNDNVVSDDLSESVLVSSSAYLLFYERAGISTKTTFKTGHGNSWNQCNDINNLGHQGQLTGLQRNFFHRRQPSPFSHDRGHLNNTTMATSPIPTRMIDTMLSSTTKTSIPSVNFILHSLLGFLFYAAVLLFWYSYYY